MIPESMAVTRKREDIFNITIWWHIIPDSLVLS